MNVAVVEPTEAEDEPRRDVQASEWSEWIDPEGDDWLAAIYRFLTQDARRAEFDPAAEVDHWFG